MKSRIQSSLVLGLLGLLLVGCTSLSTTGNSSQPPTSTGTIRQWTLKVPAPDDFVMVGDRVEVTSGGVLWTSASKTWKPTPTALSFGTSCTLLGPGPGALICTAVNAPAGGVTEVYLQSMATSKTETFWSGSAQPVTQHIFSDATYLVWQGTDMTGQTTTVVYDWTQASIQPLTLPTGFGLGLIGNTFTYEIPPQDPTEPPIVNQITLPDGGMKPFGGTFPFLVDPIQGGNWVYAFSGNEAYPSHVYAVSLQSPPQQSVFNMPAALLENLRYAVGPGYLLGAQKGLYGIYVDASQTWYPLSIKVTGNDSVGTNGADVAYILQGTSLHLIQVSIPSP